jgi:hypothetical protein
MLREATTWRGRVLRQTWYDGKGMWLGLLGHQSFVGSVVCLAFFFFHRHRLPNFASTAIKDGPFAPDFVWFSTISMTGKDRTS